MLEYDLVIKDGMIIDGMRLPRYSADIGVKDGKDCQDRSPAIAPGEKGLGRGRAYGGAGLYRSAYP